MVMHHECEPLLRFDDRRLMAHRTSYLPSGSRSFATKYQTHCMTHNHQAVKRLPQADAVARAA
jgi:hypothetical protein